MKKHLPFSSEGSSLFLEPIFVVGFYTWGYVEIKPLYIRSIMCRILDNIIIVTITKRKVIVINFN